ncbi:ribosomal L7Ae/L30e/S12e/Gadd45 family protein [Candidatus Woesearchaeota archaeon]|nr:ribosomal L7Ae/L30e/S12e/Gadd45 family protein [Candidatus Woesearchaeota archaeon]
MTVAEIKKLLGNEKLVIGTDRVLKNLKLGKIEKVFLSSNCNSGTVADVKQYASFEEVTVEELDMPNDELGVFCKKPFSVSIIGILR